MLVHFASGPHKFPAPWVNVDYSAAADVKADLLEELPERLEMIHVAYVGHFLEHLTPVEAVAFLARVRARMLTGCKIVVVGPDVEKADLLRIGDPLRTQIGKHGEPNGHDRSECHLWDCTGRQVVDLLQRAGWHRAVEINIRAMRLLHPDVPMISDVGWQFAAQAFA